LFEPFEDVEGGEVVEGLRLGLLKQNL
jgi:hypothetical protein